MLHGIGRGCSITRIVLTKHDKSACSCAICHQGAQHTTKSAGEQSENDPSSAVAEPSSKEVTTRTARQVDAAAVDAMDAVDADTHEMSPQEKEMWDKLSPEDRTLAVRLELQVLRVAFEKSQVRPHNIRSTGSGEVGVARFLAHVSVRVEQLTQSQFEVALGGSV